MNDFISNIRDEREEILTDVHFLANDYTNYPESAQLDGTDTIEIKSIQKNGFLISVSRRIESPDKNFFSFMVSYDIAYGFKEPYESIDYMSKEELYDLVCKESDFFVNNCIAKTSLIISQISAQLGNNIPIISPARLMI